MGSEDPREREDLCGQLLAPEFPGEELAEKYDPKTWHEARFEFIYCSREVWAGADDGRCIWHADIAGKPPDELLAALSDRPARLDRAVLRRVQFPDEVDLAKCRFWYADLSGVLLRGADLREVDCYEADLGGAFLDSVDLSNADLMGVDLRGADLWNADLSGADLSGADLSGATLRGTDLTACKLRETTFEDATFDEATTFGAMSGYEIEAAEVAADESWLASHVSSRFRALGQPAASPHWLELAETQYRTIQRLRREHDLKQDLGLEIQEKHARRKRALAEGRYRDWLKLAFYRWPMGYGEKPWHVVGTSVVVILSSTLGYFLAGPFARTPPPEEADVIGGALLSSLPVTLPPWLAELLASLYFSVVTFTTLGYGDLQPASGAAQAVATVESFLGALLMALLVFVLGRRATW